MGRTWNKRAAILVALAGQAYGVGMVLTVAAMRSSTARILLLLAAVATGTIGMLGVVSDADPVMGRSLLAISAGLIGIIIEPVINRESPAVLCTSMLAGFMAMAAFVPWMVDDPGSFGFGWVDVCIPDVVETTQWLILGAIVSYSVGLTFLSRALRPLSVFVTERAKGVLRSVEANEADALRLLTGVGFAVFAYLIVQVGYGYLTKTNDALTGAIAHARALLYVAVYALNARMFLRRRVEWSVMALNALLLTYELTSGSKARFATNVLIPLVLIYVMTRPRVNLRAFLAFVGTILVSLLFLFPWMVQFRAELAASDRPDEPTADQLFTALDHWADDYGEKLSILTHRTGSAEQVGAIASIVHWRVERESSHLITRLGFFWIPRVFWPDKPTEMNPNEIGRESGRLHDSNRETAVISTGIGELFIYLGPFGVFLMALAGYWMRVLEDCIGWFSETSAVRIAMAIVYFKQAGGIVSGQFESMLTGATITLMVSFAALVAILFFAGVRNSAESRPTEPRPTSA